MNRTLCTLIASLALAVGATALAQVASAEILNVDATAPHSRGVAAWVHDDSVGEVTILVEARDAAGNPVAGAPVSWTVRNTTDNLAFVVGSSAMMGGSAISAHNGVEVSVDGGVTDENGRAYLVLDSQTAGDARVHVEVGGVAAETYSGGDMRVVWF